MHGVDLDYSEGFGSIDSYSSMAQNGFEIVDIKEYTEYDSDTGWTSTFCTGTVRIDISRVPQI